MYPIIGLSGPEMLEVTKPTESYTNRTHSCWKETEQYSLPSRRDPLELKRVLSNRSYPRV